MYVTYRLGRILLAQLGLSVVLAIVVVCGVRLVLLRGKLVGNGAAVLRIEVLVAIGHTLGIAGPLLELGYRDVALVACLVDAAVSDVGLT